MFWKTFKSYKLHLGGLVGILMIIRWGKTLLVFYEKLNSKKSSLQRIQTCLCMISFAITLLNL